MKYKEMADEKKHFYRTFYKYPNNEILVWEKWIKIRNAEAKSLGFRTKRPPVDLVMNLLEKLREEKEDKITLEHAQIEKKPKLRGNTLWEQPLRLKQPCYCQPEYVVQRTAAEMGRPKVIKHIGVPNYIQETEKGLIGTPERHKYAKLDKEHNNYKQTRQELLQKKIKKIDPFRSELGDLMVKGNKPQPPPPTPPKLPEITETLDSSPSPKVLSGVYAIKVNNSIFYKASEKSLAYLEELKKKLSNENCNDWTYYFNVPVKRVGRFEMSIQNLGTVVIRYCWKKKVKAIPFIPEDPPDQLFFFNKNEDSIAPGQTKTIHFTFISDKPGIFHETWEFRCLNVFFFESQTDKFIVNLSADAVEDLNTIKSKTAILEARIEGQINIQMAKCLLTECITNATAYKIQTYAYKNMFLEADFFLMKNPVCFYHQSEVAKLHQLFTEMAPGEAWDLSITSWREKMMARVFEDRMKYFELLKLSHCELLKPWYEGESVVNQKRRAMKLLLGQLADKFQEEYDRIRSIYSENVQAANDAYRSPDSSYNEVEETTDHLILNTINNTFYLVIYEHVANTIELCAGVLSSIDLNRWIKFDFCQH